MYPHWNDATQAELEIAIAASSSWLEGPCSGLRALTVRASFNYEPENSP